MLYAQLVRGYSPTQAGLLLAPMAVVSIVAARQVGSLTDRVHPRILTSFGFVTLMTSMVALSFAMRPETPLWVLVLALGAVGLGSSFLWAPLSATANRNLPMHQAGAGAGVYNANRQVGAVLGSAAIAVLMDARLAAHGLGTSPAGTETATGSTPAAVLDAFSAAMGQSLLLVPAVLALGLLAVLAFERPGHFASR